MMKSPAADLQEVGLHDLRHCNNTNIRKTGVARNITMSILGHLANDMNFRYDSGDEIDLELVPKARLELARGNPH